jgi:hypothetical protein
VEKNDKIRALFSAEIAETGLASTTGVLVNINQIASRKFFCEGVLPVIERIGHREPVAGAD